MEENAGFGAAEIIKLYDRWRKTFRAFNRDFAVFFFFFFSLETEYFVSTSASTENYTNFKRISRGFKYIICHRYRIQNL